MQKRAKYACLVGIELCVKLLLEEAFLKRVKLFIFGVVYYK